MSRLRDFQLATDWFPGTMDAEKALNVALFPCTESVFYWLRGRKLDAPFAKLAVCFVDQSSKTPMHGHVMNVLGVCQAWVGVDTAEFIARAGDPRWVMAATQRALEHVATQTGWRSVELEDEMDRIAERPFPFVHRFERLARTDRRARVRFVPWISVRPGETRFGVTVGDREVVLLARPVLEVELEFRGLHARLLDGKYTLLERDGTVIAAVDAAGVATVVPPRLPAWFTRGS